MFTLRAGSSHGVAHVVAPPQTEYPEVAVVQATTAVGTDCYNGAITGDVAATMGTPGSSINASGPTVMTGMQVRRLTPVECERLQGFPDNYTAIHGGVKQRHQTGRATRRSETAWPSPA